MTRLLKICVLSVAAAFLASCATPSPEVDVLYDTTAAPNAQGIRAQVRFPAGWTMEGGGSRSSIIQIVHHDMEGSGECLMLQAIELGEDAAILFGDEADFDASAKRAKWVYMLNSITNTQVLSLKSLTHAGEPAVMVDLAVRSDNDEAFYLASRMLFVKREENMLVLACSASDLPVNAEKAGLRQKANEDGLCRTYFDSLKWLN